MSEKVGAIIISYNDDYKLSEWFQYYQTNKKIFDEYIIVDNGSNIEYITKLRSLFKEAKIIELDHNVGTTGAYNIGIKYLLNKKSISYIMLLGNDIKIDNESIIKLKKFLYNHDDVGMVGPILLKKDSDLIEDGGCTIDIKSFSLRTSNVDKKISDLDKKEIEVDAVTGGANLAKCDFYKKVGLQDEVLFMYSDEVDMGLRAKQCGYKMFLVCDSLAWHQHINPSYKRLRLPYSAYLMARNKIYLAYKYGDTSKAINLFLKYVFVDFLKLFKSILTHDEEKMRYSVWHLQGAFHGIKHDMKENKYSLPL